MTIKMNGRIYHVEEKTNLASFLQSQGIKPEGLAVAMNDKVIPKTAWERTVLDENQELLVIHAVSGG